MSVVIYITFQAFLDLTANFSDDLNNEKFDAIQLRSQFTRIFQYSVFVTEETRENILLHDNNPYVKALIKSGKITSNKLQFDEIRNCKSNFFKGDRVRPQLFILPNFADDLMIRLQRDSGCFFLKSLLALEKLNFVKSFYLRAYQYIDWDKISDLVGPHNCLLIEDPYILLSANAISNCLKFLRKVIPKSIRVKYAITIIGRSTAKGTMTDYNRIDLAIKELTDGIHAILKSVFVEVLTYDGLEFHDRSIITNNTYIFCGSGFGITSNKNVLLKDSNWISCGLLNAFEIDNKPEIGLQNLKYNLDRIRQKMLVEKLISENPIFQLCS